MQDKLCILQYEDQRQDRLGIYVQSSESVLEIKIDLKIVRLDQLRKTTLKKVILVYELMDEDHQSEIFILSPKNQVVKIY